MHCSSPHANQFSREIYVALYIGILEQDLIKINKFMADMDVTTKYRRSRTSQTQDPCTLRNDRLRFIQKRFWLKDPLQRNLDHWQQSQKNLFIGKDLTIYTGVLPHEWSLVQHRHNENYFFSSQVDKWKKLCQIWSFIKYNLFGKIWINNFYPDQIPSHFHL